MNAIVQQHVNVFMSANYQQTQSQWPQLGGPVTKLAYECNAIDRQSRQYFDHKSFTI